MKEINALLAGFRRFQSRYFRDDRELYDQLKSGQKPRILLIGCCDSRVDPAMLTDADPGDLFVVRNVANLVPPYQPDTAYHGVSAAIEYAVQVLEVEHVIILGHSQCGGIRGLMDVGAGKTVGEFIGPWVSLAEPALQSVTERLPDAPLERQAKACELETILLSLGNLLTFPWLKERVDAGTVALHGWYFDLATSELLCYQPEDGTFQTLVSGVLTQKLARRASTDSADV